MTSECYLKSIPVKCFCGAFLYMPSMHSGSIPASPKTLCVESNCIYHSISDRDLTVVFLVNALVNELLLSSVHCYVPVGIITCDLVLLTHTRIKEVL